MRTVSMTSWSIQAILSARKSQTRRPIAARRDFPLGHLGDFLGVRETWRRDSFGRIRYRADKPGSFGPWKSSRFMPGEFVRLWLELVEEPTRVKLQDISPEDALAEGIELPWDKRTLWGLDERGEAMDSFRVLWDSIYAEQGRGWDVNPTVWRYAFRAHTAKGPIHVRLLPGQRSEPPTPAPEIPPGEQGPIPGPDVRAPASGGAGQDLDDVA
jgi:hypothetical protein